MPDIEVCKNVGLPTYLKEFIGDEQPITLILRKRTVEDRKGSGTPRKYNISESISHLDLTGSPLKIELNGDDDELEWTMVSERYPLWTPEESRHLPLSLQEARQHLRDLSLNTKKSEEDKNPIFCLCDGCDAKKTVVLGLSKYNHTRTYSLNILGCFPQSDEVASSEYMMKEHLKNVRPKGQHDKTDFLISKTYFIYGSNIKNCPNIDRAEYNGSVSVKISSKDVSEPFEKYSDIEVNLQAILGHRHSTVHSLWEELEFIHRLINILKETSPIDLEIVDICRSPLTLSEITNEITNCFSIAVFERKERESLDLENLRDKTFLDLLWDILKKCRDVLDLQESFLILFEELAEAQSRIQLPPDNESTIASIMNGIINGTLAVPTITLCQSLEFLIELGLECLKNNYMAIIDHFCSNIHEDFLKTWNRTNENKVQAGQSIKRKTRTVLSKVAAVDTTNINHKHAIITQMHILTEFLFLANGCCKMFEDNFEDICITLYNHLVSTKANGIEFPEVQSERIREFSFNINHMNQDVIKGKNFTKQVVKIISSTSCAEVKTIFHLSLFPLIPESIFNQYDNALASMDSLYYICKFMQFTEKIGD